MSEYNTSTYVTNEQMVKYCTNAIDNWAELLGDILNQLTDQVDEINGEVVRDNLVEKVQYLLETKEAIRDKIISTGSGMPFDEIFRNYPRWILGLSGDWILKTVTHTKRSPATIKLEVVLKDEYFSAEMKQLTNSVIRLYRAFSTNNVVHYPSIETMKELAGTHQVSVNHDMVSYPSKSIYKERGE